MGASGPLAINVSLFKSLPYNPVTDLAPVVHVASVPLVLVVHESFPAKNVKELIALLKAKPDGYSYASAGNGTPQHLSAELFKQLTGTKMVHVPYKGSGPAINDLIGGQIPIAFESLIPILPQLKGTKVRALAVTSLKPSALLPDVPTLDAVGRQGLRVDRVVRRRRPGQDAQADRGQAQRGDGQGAQGPGSEAAAHRDRDRRRSPARRSSSARSIKSEIAKWAPVVKASGATVD